MSLWKKNIFWTGILPAESSTNVRVEHRYFKKENLLKIEMEINKLESKKKELINLRAGFFKKERVKQKKKNLELSSMSKKIGDKTQKNPTMPSIRNRVFTSTYKELKIIRKFYVKIYVTMSKNLSEMVFLKI